MDEKRLMEQIPRAVDAHCAHLHADPYLVQKVLHAAERKETPIVRSKMKLALTLVLILMLLTATAVAAVLLTGMELIEQEVVPLAQQNDGEVRPVEEFTHEELKALIARAEENGIFLDDDTSLMRALRMGEGYWEEETIMALCREAFGGLIYEWTVEEQYFFHDMMVAIGYAQENNMEMPGEGEMTPEEARALAVETIRKHYGADLPLTDRTQYRHTENYYAGGPEGNSFWNFSFLPCTLEGAWYDVSMDGQGQWINHGTDTAFDWSDYNETVLQQRVDTIYNYRQSGAGKIYWEHDAWHAFGQKLPGAKHSDKWNKEFDGYAATTYLLPGEGDLTKKQARDIAFADAGIKDYTSVTELLLGKGDQRIWKISFNTSEKTGRNQVLSYEIDSVTGAILRMDNISTEAEWARYMLHETYLPLRPEETNVLSEDKAIEMAVAALYRKLGREDIPYTDSNYYTIDARFIRYTGGYTLIFNPKVMEYGRASVDVNGIGGSVSINFAREPGVTGDNLFSRFEDIYGPNIDWDQDMWVKFGEEMKKYEATSFEGKLFKMTTYLPESAVKISRDKAMDIAYLDSDHSDINRIVLIDAAPNPIWKVRVSADPTTVLYEIDAMTGEILDKELYYIQMSNFDHTMKMYTLRRVFMPAHLAEFGVERVAMELCVKAFPRDFEDLGDCPDVLADKAAYTATVEGMTVTFAARNPLDTSYRVTVAEDAMSAKVEKIGNAEALADSDPELAAVYAQYGENHRYWPIEMQHKYLTDGGYSVPQEGEMTYEEALAYARKLIVDEVGQEEFDVMGDCHIGAHMIRYSDGVRVAWYFYFTDDPATEENGWRVTFFLHDNVPSDTYEVQHVKEYGNG